MGTAFLTACQVRRESALAGHCRGWRGCGAEFAELGLSPTVIAHYERVVVG